MAPLILWLLPITLFLTIAPFTPAWDMDLAHFFYRDGHFRQDAFYTFIYRYATWPAFFAGGMSCLLLALSFYKSEWIRWRRPAIFLLSVLILFEGLVVHNLLKNQWGRPRPKQVIEFGGDQPFRPFYSPNFHATERARSFPCGHCGMGFYFMSLAWLGWKKRSKPLLWSGVALAVGLGFLLSWTRIAQGGHFFSDILGSLLVLWYGVLLSDRWILSSHSSNSSESGSNSSSF